jgi:hypothetical protein
MNPLKASLLVLTVGISGCVVADLGGETEPAPASKPAPGAGGSAAAPRPEPKPPELVLDSMFGKDALFITGTVTLPVEVPPGRRVRLAITEGIRAATVGEGHESMALSLQTSARKLTYVVRQLSSSKYTVFVAIDLNGDLQLGSGDLGGYYAAGASAPVLDPQAATLIQLARSLPGADFTLGTMQ